MNERHCKWMNDIGSYVHDRSHKAFLNDPLTFVYIPTSCRSLWNNYRPLISTRDTKISALKIAAENENIIEALSSTITLFLEEGVFQSMRVARKLQHQTTVKPRYKYNVHRGRENFEAKNRAIAWSAYNGRVCHDLTAKCIAIFGNIVGGTSPRRTLIESAWVHVGPIGSNYLRLGLADIKL